MVPKPFFQKHSKQLFNYQVESIYVKSGKPVSVSESLDDEWRLFCHAPRQRGLPSTRTASESVDNIKPWV